MKFEAGVRTYGSVFFSGVHMLAAYFPVICVKCTHCLSIFVFIITIYFCRDMFAYMYTFITTAYARACVCVCSCAGPCACTLLPGYISVSNFSTFMVIWMVSNTKHYEKVLEGYFTFKCSLLCE